MHPTSEMITLRDGRSIRLGPVEPEHSGLYRAYMMELADESPWTGTMAHEVKDERKQRERLEKLVDDPCEWMVGAFDPKTGCLVADCGWRCADYQKVRHVATLGIGILQPWRGAGLGRILMEHAIEAVRNDPHAIKIELGVFSENTIARRMYDSLGFTVEGVRKRALRQPDGCFQDDVIMGLWLGEMP